MKQVFLFLSISLFLIFESCSSSHRVSAARVNNRDIKTRVIIKHKVPARVIDTKNIHADELVAFAESLQGVPYKYGSADVRQGVDCSGFISYVFSHYNIAVPRRSVDFTNAGQEIRIQDCRRGDIILFTGSDAASGVVGHMGIITKNNDRQITFIHAASGSNKGVMVSGMSNYFVSRFVKVIRIFSVFE